MRSRGVDVSDAIEGGRRTPAGQGLRWKVAVLGPKNPLHAMLVTPGDACGAYIGFVGPE